MLYGDQMKMKTITVVAVVLLVALFTANGEAKPFGRGRPHNRPGGRRDEDSDGPDCRRHCPRPTRDSRVCAEVDGLRNHTFPSPCQAERIACQTGKNITVVSEGACPRPSAAVDQGGRGGQLGESESEENASQESNEDEEENTTTTFAASSTTTVEPPTITGSVAIAMTSEGAVSTDSSMTSTDRPILLASIPGGDGHRWSRCVQPFCRRHRARVSLV